ncbi:TonB-dependent receptor plug domain-containing protein [Marinifilum sp. N1E240]|uniref:TonB-dependent receptor plug domain-containing protein n=1 Tax=Marinifilum sp. N1E240 TaxID=2608082 RepID=UPI00128B1189|nr:TonB-dependent receptor plug domain-containing protein [Marinifilum sp. N1E240]MPQ48501.1 TonB-dependent receptor plug domain-containing protein [Marinifilum sp. N1E240]
MNKSIILTLIYLCSQVINVEATIIEYEIAEKNKRDTTKNYLTTVVKNENTDLILSVQELFLGKISGLSITKLNGDPGSSYKFQSRGVSSLYSKGDHPLVFFDGIQILVQPEEFGNFLNTINPADIESIEFLKNAADIALYGYQAGNGVLIIKSKKSTGKKPISISFDNSVSISSRSNTVDVLNANHYKSAMNTYLPSSYSEYLTMLGNSDTDWQEEVLQSTFGNHQNLAISGRIGKTFYRVSGGHDKQKGVLKESDYARWTSRLNLNRLLFKDRLKLSFGFGTSRVDHSFGNLDAYYAAMRFNPTLPLSIQESEEYPLKVNTYIGQGNPLNILNNSENEIDQRNWTINFKAEYEVPFLPGVNAEIYLGKNKSNDKSYNAQASRYYMNNEIFIEANANTFDLNSNLFKGGLNYQKKFNTLISALNVSIGYIKQTDRLKKRKITASNSINKNDYNIENFGYQILDQNYLNNLSDSYFSLETEFTHLRSKMESLYGRLSIELTDKLSVIGNYRMDTDEDWNEKVYSASAGVSYQLLSRPRKTSYVNNIGIRLGHGLIGKGNKSSVKAYLNRIYTSNIGVDMSFFNGRLNAVIEGYIEKSKNLPFEVDVYSGSSHSTKTIYDGQFDNKGIEFTVSAVPIVIKDLNWTLHFNANYNRNEFNNFEYFLTVNNPITGYGSTIQYTATGETYNSYYVLKQVYDSNGKPIEGMYKDVNNDGSVDHSDRRFYKSAEPKILIGFTSNIQYKNWDVNLKLRSAIGNYMYNNIDAYLGTFGLLPDNRTKDALYTNFKYRPYFSDYYVQKASFVRMENFTIGYSFKQFLGKDIKARFYAGGKNLFTITDYKGLNPEAPNGIDYNNYPQARIFTFGLQFDF